MKQKHKEKLNSPIIKTLTLSSFLLGISSAFILYLESDYFKIAAGSDNVTLFFIVAYAVCLALIFNWHHLIRIFGKRRVFLMNLFVEALVVVALALLPVGKIGACLLVLYIILVVLSWIDIDILLETCSSDKRTGRIRGAFLTVMNSGYLVTPLFAGYMISRWGFHSAFFASASLIILVGLVCFSRLQNIRRKGCASF